MPRTPYAAIVELLQAGQLQPAMAACAALLATHPDDPVALHLDGVIAWRRGDPAAGVTRIRRALELRPAMADAEASLGHLYTALDRLDDADAAFARALQINPAFAVAEQGRASIRADLDAKNAAIARHQQGAYREAGEAYRALLARRPRYPEVLNNLGVLLMQQGDASAAARLLQQATTLKPEVADSWANLGAALKRSGRIDAAVRAYRKAIELAPALANAHYNLGHALVEMHRLEEALACYQRAVVCEPAHAGARLAIVHQRRHLCDWRNFAADEAELRELIDAGVTEVTPFHALVAFDDPPLQAVCAERLSRQAALGAVPLTPRRVARGERIRVGYLSSDFRRHPVAWLISELIERHDRARFEVIGLSHGPDDGSEERQRLARAFDRVLDLRADNLDAAAARIRAEGIDILVDLNGHTLGSRTGILARRPAPLQLSWLGYPGAMGAPFVDYVIADAFAVPTSEQRWYAEKLLHLPECFQPSDTTKTIADAPSRAACGLPEGSFVFCCFNNAYKLTPAFFEAWMRLLSAVPGAVLWLVEMSPAVRANLAREASTRGIDPARLVFAQRAPLEEYLARYRLADLFLDTLPYNAGTTANDALWAGLPLITCAGRSFAARMAGSLLHAVGLAELVTHSLADYETLALRLAREPPLLASLRARLATNRATAPLFDCARFTRHLEDAYERIHAVAIGDRPGAQGPTTKP